MIIAGVVLAVTRPGLDGMLIASRKRMLLELNSDEADLLRRTLSARHTEILSEIAHTDARKFRDALREQATIIERLLARLSAGEQSASEARGTTPSQFP